MSVVAEAMQTYMEHWRGWPMWDEVVDEVQALSGCDQEAAEKHLNDALLDGDVDVGLIARALDFVVKWPVDEREGTA